MFSERIINVHGFCILPMGLACLCNRVLVINVVNIFTFGYLLAFTHDLYILLGGLMALCKHRGRHGPCPRVLTSKPHVNGTKEITNESSSGVVIHWLKSMERCTSVSVLTGTCLGTYL